MKSFVSNNLTKCGLSTVALCVLLCLTALPGCRAFAVLFGEHPTKDVPAEYPYLADQRVCILVRAEMETLFEYPHVQWEIADHVRLALEANIPALSCVEPRRVVDFQRGNADWESMDPARIGKRFLADRVLEIDLTQYTTREPDSPYLYRGHISAVIRVYNTAHPDCEATYTREVVTVYPPDSPGSWGTSDRDIRRATMEAFAQDVAGKFYDRKVREQ